MENTIWYVRRGPAPNDREFSHGSGMYFGPFETLIETLGFRDAEVKDGVVEGWRDGSIVWIEHTYIAQVGFTKSIFLPLYQDLSEVANA